MASIKTIHRFRFVPPDWAGPGENRPWTRCLPGRTAADPFRGGWEGIPESPAGAEHLVSQELIDGWADTLRAHWTYLTASGRGEEADVVAGHLRSEERTLLVRVNVTQDGRR